VGNLKLAPLELGADNYGDFLNSDFEFGLDNFDPMTAVTYGIPLPPLADTASSNKSKVSV